MHYIIIYKFALSLTKNASVVQWLGFHPSKVEVRVRFTAVAKHAPHQEGRYILPAIFHDEYPDRDSLVTHADNWSEILVDAPFVLKRLCFAT